jgi:hypothetical protein
MDKLFWPDFIDMTTPIDALYGRNQFLNRSVAKYRVRTGPANPGKSILVIESHGKLKFYKTLTKYFTYFNLPVITDFCRQERSEFCSFIISVIVKILTNSRLPGHGF